LINLAYAPQFSNVNRLRFGSMVVKEEPSEFFKRLALMEGKATPSQRHALGWANDEQEIPVQGSVEFAPRDHDVSSGPPYELRYPNGSGQFITFKDDQKGCHRSDLVRLSIWFHAHFPHKDWLNPLPKIWTNEGKIALEHLQREGRDKDVQERWEMVEPYHLATYDIHFRDPLTYIGNLMYQASKCARFSTRH
jgi:hypothetical protein